MAPRFALALSILLMNAHAASQILGHGHRGARAVRPENTMPAFEYALKIGADVLELDLAVTKDNVLVVSHDPKLSEAICTAPAGWKGTNVIREMTLEQLRLWDCGAKRNPQFPRQEPVPGTKAPTLDEVFALAPRGTFEFNVETKIFAKQPELTPSPEEFSRLLLEAIRKHKLETRVIVQSFDFRTLRAMKAMAPEIRLSALFEPFGTWDPVKATVDLGAPIISPHYRLVNPGFVERAHKAGLQVVPWTANEEAEWRKLADAKVDAIISDDPAALLAWLKR